MRILCAFGRHAYGDAARGSSYEAAHFLPALRALGHEVALFDSFDRTAHCDFAALNRSFLEQVEAFRPDLVFCVLMHYELWTETLEMARASAAVVNWGADDSWKYDQFLRFIAPHVDLYVTTYTEALARAQAERLDTVTLSQWAVNPALLAPPLPAAECRHQVSFVGTAYGNRRRWVAALAARGLQVECFGHGWPGGAVPEGGVGRILRESVISLNFGDSALQWRGARLHYNRQVKARTFEVPGCGGFLLTERADGIERYYEPDKEVVLFDSVDDAAAKIRRYLGEPALRDRIARAGYERTAREHTYLLRFAPLLERAQSLGIARRDAAWRFDRPAFDRLAAGHATGAGLAALRALLVAPARALFGVQRGPRAARRVLFEFCWRLAGRHTYSHAGLPGRLFYRES